MLPVLKLESRGYDRSQYGLDSLRPCLKSAFGAKRTWTGRQNRMDRSKMTQSGHERLRIAAVQTYP
jgi:hypothetical protein